MKCSGLVEGEYEIEKLKLPGAAMGVVALVAGFLGGFLGTAALLLAAAAVGSVLMAFTFDYRCQDCDAIASRRFMFDGERDDIRDRRASYFMRAGLFGAGSLLVAGFWVAAILAGVRVKSAADATPAVAAESPVAALTRAGDIEGLARALAEPRTREQAVTALVGVGNNAVPFVITMLGNPDEYTRRAALGVLERIGPRTDRAIDALLGVVQGDAVPGVRARAIDVLGRAGSAAKRAVPVLEPLLADPYLGGTTLSALRQIAPGTDWRARKKELTGK